MHNIPFLSNKVNKSYPIIESKSKNSFNQCQQHEHNLVLHGSAEGRTDDGTTGSLSLKKSKTVLVELDLIDDNVGGGNTDLDSLTVNLVTGDTFNVDDPFATVNLGNTTFVTLELTTHDLDFIILANGKGTDVVLGTEFLAQTGAHDDATF